MKEYVGVCNTCNKAIYCENGFLNGIHEQGKLYCEACYKDKE